MPLLDTVLPDYEVGERHSVALPVSRAQVLRRRWLKAIARRA